MSQPLPDPRKIYAARAKVTADNRKRDALNAHLPDAREAMRRKGASFPAAVHRGYPKWGDLSPLLYSLIGEDATLKFAGELVDALVALDNDQAATKFFEGARKQANDIWVELQAKDAPTAAELDALFISVFTALDRWVPRDDGKLKPPSKD
ncbi:MAG: hypothetical protein JNN31_10475 [Dechloromonas sp.]|nr:hypothetical protein [Dechloromonas sp.]